MDQMDLFNSDIAEPVTAEEEISPICSGRVGPIRFGSTDTSYALTKEVLADLAMRSDDDAGKGSS